MQTREIKDYTEHVGAVSSSTITTPHIVGLEFLEQLKFYNNFIWATSWENLFMPYGQSDLVENPKDRFSHAQAHFSKLKNEVIIELIISPIVFCLFFFFFFCFVFFL